MLLLQRGGATHKDEWTETGGCRPAGPGPDQWSSLSDRYAQMVKGQSNKLKWVDEEWKAELKANPVPNEQQHALAETIENTGGHYIYFATFTFRPNDHEEFVQQVGKDDFRRNMKVSWCEGDKIVKRVGRDGQMTKGTRGISPGWSARAAEGAVVRFINNNKHLSKTRWFMNIEGSKYRSCAHGHGLFANAADVPWEYVAEQWEQKYGRFSLELVDDKDGMAMYLAKKYVGKEYGSDDFLFRFSRNCRRPVPDPLPLIAHKYRYDLFLNNMKKDESKKHDMVRWKTFKEMINAH